MNGTPSFATDLQIVGAGPDTAALRADPVWAWLDAYASAHGFGHWTYSAAPISDRSDDCAVTLTTYPDLHTKEFFRRRLDRTNPGRRYAKSHGLPTTYAAIREGASPPNAAVAAQLALNRVHDVTRGVLIPLHDEIGTHASLGLAYRGSEIELESCFPQMKEDLSRFALELHQVIQRVHPERFIRNRVPRLTDRQRDVIRLFVDGRSSSEVAGQLRLSIHTIDKHVARIKARLGARSLAQASALAIKWRLLD
jgi:DNA-binding CsgD family transcriptional regulator